jgi:hypothetical protein
VPGGGGQSIGNYPRDWPTELSARDTEPFSQRSSSPSLADDG